MLRARALALALVVAAPVSAGELALDDRRALEAVFEAAGLLDPRGGRWVRATAVVRGHDGFATEAEVEVEGWADAGVARPGRLVLLDLREVLVVPDTALIPTDFEVALDRALGRGGAARAAPGAVLAWAAWALRLGHEALAADLVERARARAPQGAIEDLVRAERAWRLLLVAVRAFERRADDEALLAARALAPLGDAADAYGPWRTLLADLERRVREAQEAPRGLVLDEPTVERLVELLEDVVGERTPAGGLDLLGDPTARDLLDAEDAAVPALLDCLERDARLTRTVEVERVRARGLHPVPVRQVAVELLGELLGTSALLEGWSDEPGAVARRARAYWAAHGDAPLEERLRRLLLDAAAPPRARAEASERLSRDPLRAFALRLEGPTAAEAILRAFEQDLGPLALDVAQASPHLAALVALGDERIAPALEAHHDATLRPSLRLELALACEALGAPGPLDRVATQLAAGRLFAGLERLDQEAPIPLTRLVAALARAGRPAADAALLAFAGPGHPLHTVARARVLAFTPLEGDDAWLHHPACLALLRAVLEDERPSGRRYRLVGDRIHASDGEAPTVPAPPPAWLDPAACEGDAASRWCDEAALRLGDLLAGTPRAHPLLRDRDARLADVRRFAARAVPGARRPTLLEAAALGVNAGPWGRPGFIPDLPPLDRAATAADVEAGRAVFHLDGRGRRAPLRLPAMAEVGEAPALVLQAEVDADGALLLGVLTVDALRRVPAAEVTGLRPLPTPEEHAAAAAALVDAALAGDVDAVAAVVFGEEDVSPSARSVARMLQEELQDLSHLTRDELLRWVHGCLRPAPGSGWRMQ
ncbi:MAG: hypothetical protein M9894_35700 [Planctomycetes bacterium]|nr:hypothetical protein [Planctomycetota bacterium]